MISYENGIEFIEIKVGDRKLTKNQPEGYIKELLNRPEENKKLYFLIPRNYYYIDELRNRIESVKESKIIISIKHWENFFEYCKKNIIFKKNKILFEYYNLLKSWFGYETVVFNKGEQNLMKQNGKIMAKAEKLLESIYSLLEQNGFKPKPSKWFNEIGIYIDGDKKDVYYGWVGIWFSLWEETGDIFIYTISNNDNKRYYNNFISKYKDCKTYEYREDDSPDGKSINKYICFDDDIFDRNNDESIIIKKLLDIIKNIKSKK